MSKKVDYFVRFDIVGSTPQYDLFELDARLVPFMLRAIEGVKGRSFWANDTEAEEAYYRLSELQARLLMPFGERYINEVRALRQGDNTPLQERDPELDPYSLSLTTLQDIQFVLQAGSGSAAQILERIEQALVAQTASEEDQLAAILRIAAIIAGAPTP